MRPPRERRYLQESSARDTVRHGDSLQEIAEIRDDYSGFSVTKVVFNSAAGAILGERGSRWLTPGGTSYSQQRYASNSIPEAVMFPTLDRPCHSMTHSPAGSAAHRAWVAGLEQAELTPPASPVRAAFPLLAAEQRSAYFSSCLRPSHIDLWT